MINDHRRGVAIGPRLESGAFQTCEERERWPRSVHVEDGLQIFHTEHPQYDAPWGPPNREVDSFPQS